MPYNKSFIDQASSVKMAGYRLTWVVSIDLTWKILMCMYFLCNKALSQGAAASANAFILQYCANVIPIKYFAKFRAKSFTAKRYFAQYFRRANEKSIFPKFAEAKFSVTTNKLRSNEIK